MFGDRGCFLIFCCCLRQHTVCFCMQERSVPKATVWQRHCCTHAATEPPSAPTPCVEVIWPVRKHTAGRSCGSQSACLHFTRNYLLRRMRWAMSAVMAKLVFFVAPSTMHVVLTPPNNYHHCCPCGVSLACMTIRVVWQCTSIW